MPLRGATTGPVPGGAGRSEARTGHGGNAATVDRLTFDGAIIQTGTESYRLAHTKAQVERAAVG